jgi:hypothetical protein
MPAPLLSRFLLPQQEGRLVFLLAGYPDVAAGNIQLRPDLDWSRLLQVAWDEGAVGALRDHCRMLSQDVMPMDVQRRLAFLALECDLRMRNLEARAEESLAALAAAGIDVVVLKGAALAATTYGSFAARPMNDLDLLVDPSRAEEARSVLFGAGWMTNPWQPGDSNFRTHHHLPPLIDTGGKGLRLEIHRELLPPGHPFRMPTRGVWRDLRLVTVGAGPAFVLPANLHAVHLAIHFAWSHAMRVGAWHAFRDLATLDRAGLIDWEEFVQLALLTGASSCCYWTLRLAGTMANYAAPIGVLDALAPPLGHAILRRLERHFIEMLVRREPTPVSLRLERALWSMAIQPRRLGHGVSRPWTVSSDLAAARRAALPTATDGGVMSRIAKIGRSGAHLGSLIGA